MARAPLDSRRRLGGELRRLRLAAALSGPELASTLGIGQATVSRMETGQVRPTIETVGRWLDAVRASPTERQQLLDLAEDAQVDVTGWRSVFRGGMAPQQRAMHAFDDAAQSIRHFQPFLIPGYFQPAEYARAAMLGFRLSDDVADVDDAVSARLERAAKFRRRTRVPYHLVITELGLKTIPAGASRRSRREAWSQLLSATELRHVTVQVISQESPIQQVPVCGWMMYRMAEGAVDPEVVQVETPAALVTFTGADVPPFELAWDRMVSSACNAEESRDLIAELIRTDDS